MSACHIKQGNWKRAQETADKVLPFVHISKSRISHCGSLRQALAKNPTNSKALFRKGKALGEQGYFEKAEKILEDLLKEDSADAPAIKAELERLRLADKEREKLHNQKFKGEAFESG